MVHAPSFELIQPQVLFLLSNNDSLKHLNVWLDVGRVKNRNKNPVAEKAVQELEEELLRQEPGGGPVNPASLAVATAPPQRTFASPRPLLT